MVCSCMRWYATSPAKCITASSDSLELHTASAFITRRMEAGSTLSTRPIAACRVVPGDDQLALSIGDDQRR
jgi:hypothetical protein